MGLYVLGAFAFWLRLLLCTVAFGIEHKLSSFERNKEIACEAKGLSHGCICIKDWLKHEREDDRVSSAYYFFPLIFMHHFLYIIYNPFILGL